MAPTIAPAQSAPGATSRGAIQQRIPAVSSAEQAASNLRRSRSRLPYRLREVRRNGHWLQPGLSALRSSLLPVCGPICRGRPRLSRHSRHHRPHPHRPRPHRPRPNRPRPRQVVCPLPVAAVRFVEIGRASAIPLLSSLAAHHIANTSSPSRTPSSTSPSINSAASRRRPYR